MVVVVPGPAVVVVVLFPTYPQSGHVRHFSPSKHVFGAGVVVLPHIGAGRAEPPLWHTVLVHWPATVGQNCGCGQEHGARVVVVAVVVGVSVVVVTLGSGVVVGGTGNSEQNEQSGPGTQGRDFSVVFS